MHAVVIHGPHDLRVEPVAASDVGADEVAVRIAAGGICGSDLHYYHNGGFGTVRLREPMVLGHEVAGVIASVGRDVDGFRVGDRVAVSPSLPCGSCAYCQRGQQQHCLDMRFYGSAMRFPHVQGAFRQLLVAKAAQAHRIADDLTLAEAAMAEPLAVCLHAARRAGSLLGARVLVTGCGPIGALCIIAARRAGAAEIVATDVAEAPLAIARKVGANVAVDVATAPDGLDAYKRDKGAFDVLFEASGNARALVNALDVVRPGGVIVQVGLGGMVELPINTIVAKELELRGTFRFHTEYALAVSLLGQRLVDVRPLISETLPYTRAKEAFELAGDRSRAMKVQLSFD